MTITHLGDRRLSEVTVVDLQAVLADAGMRATRNRPTSTDRSSRETCVGSLRALFGRARAAGLIRTDPAALLTKPRRARPRRRALNDTDLAELIDAVRATSNDPDLDLLVVCFHLESGARREGARQCRGGGFLRREGVVLPAGPSLHQTRGGSWPGRFYALIPRTHDEV